MISPRLACCLIVIGFAAQTLAAAPTRCGLWVIQKLPPDATTRAEMAAHLRGNSNLGGVCLNCSWKSIESEAAKPDFTALDQTLAELNKLGLKYQLGLKPGADTPDFVYANWS